MYVIGMSGKGKSKLLEHCLYQDIAAGRGCGLIDPHSLLVDDLLRLLITKGVLDDPDIRRRLIYVDPARADYIIPFIVLATDAEHPYDIAATVLEAFRRTWSECLKEAHHFSNVVTAALIVLIENRLTLMHVEGCGKPLLRSDPCCQPRPPSGPNLLCRQRFHTATAHPRRSQLFPVIAPM